MKHKPVHKEKEKLELKELQPPFLQPEGDYKKLCCPACAKEIQAEDINIQAQIAKCGSCNAIFSFEEDLAKAQAVSKKREKIERPVGIEQFYYRDELEFIINQPWTGLEVMAISIFPAFAILLTFIFFKKGIDPWIPGVLWMGALMSIVNAFLRKNHKVHINIDDDYLSVEWRPKKLQKDKRFRIGEIDQLYVRMVDGMSYGVYMIVNSPEGQKHVLLLSGFSSISKAHYLEQEIERHLGIEDRRVREETHAPTGVQIGS